MNTENENKLFKYEDDGYIYYYRSQEIMDTVKELITYPPINSSINYRLLLYADFAIDTRTNELVKNRYSIEEIIDSYIMNKGE